MDLAKTPTAPLPAGRCGSAASMCRTTDNLSVTATPTCSCTPSPMHSWEPAALPDIGRLFPNSESANQGRDSSEMLAAAAAKVAEAGFCVVNLDCGRPRRTAKIGVTTRTPSAIASPASLA